jgi:hypothetical protein
MRRVRLGPVDPQVDHCLSLLLSRRPFEPGEDTRRANGSVLEARHPTGRRSPHRPAGARSRLRARRPCRHQCSPAGGSGPACPMAAGRVPLAARHLESAVHAADSCPPEGPAEAPRFAVGSGSLEVVRLTPRRRCSQAVNANDGDQELTRACASPGYVGPVGSAQPLVDSREVESTQAA